MPTHDNDGYECDEYRGITRRKLLGRSAATAAAAVTAPAWLPRAALAAPALPASRDVLVNVFLRGGMDGLSVCVPHGDPGLYAARPTIAVPQPGAPDGALDLDGFFGLHPAAAPLLPIFQAQDLAIVHACGSTDPTRSHFEAFEKMEFAIPNQLSGSQTTGWLARHLESVAPRVDGPVRGLVLEDVMPLTLAGAPLTLPVADPTGFAFPGDPSTAPRRQQAVAHMYAGSAPPMGPAAISTLGTIGLLDAIDLASYVPAGGAVYPDSDLGRGLRATAALIKADVGIEVFMLEQGGYDTHNQQGTLGGVLAALVGDLAASLAALHADLGAGIASVTVVVKSEFGRRVEENASGGTDHGHGNCLFVLGGGVVGGTVHGTWPGLHPDDLDQGDLAITTDYRDVLSEVVAKRLGNPNLGYVFPGYAPSFAGVVV